MGLTHEVTVFWWVWTVWEDSCVRPFWNEEREGYTIVRAWVSWKLKRFNRRLLPPDLMPGMNKWHRWASRQPLLMWREDGARCEVCDFPAHTEGMLCWECFRVSKGFPDVETMIDFCKFGCVGTRRGLRVTIDSRQEKEKDLRKRSIADFSYHRRQQRKTKRAMEITREEFQDLIERPCRLCCVVPALGLRKLRGEKSLNHENCVSICFDCCQKVPKNMKMNRFIRWMERVCFFS